jgi:SOS-response transcriptional repressor LexA
MRVALRYQNLYTVKIYSIIIMKELTKQQSKVLACVEVYLNKTGFPPTRAEICKELGFKSPNAAEMHLRALEKKGYITIQSGSSRGISIVRSQQSLERIRRPNTSNRTSCRQAPLLLLKKMLRKESHAIQICFLTTLIIS